MFVFGPIPSRRLGYSLGINHIPPKHCPYSCAYCQVGRTNALELIRQDFYPPDQVLQEAALKIEECGRAGRSIDYLTLVPDGEPTLDIHLGELIKKLKSLGFPVAVISNSSLITDESVQEELCLADWVSLKVDTLVKDEWRRINRPHRRLDLDAILEGIIRFRERFSGILVTESMLVAGVNDNESSIQQLGRYLKGLQPQRSYLSIPTRPPAESEVRPPDPETLTRMMNLFVLHVPFFGLLFEAEEADFISTGNISQDILSIAAVHPIREEALQRLLASAGADWQIVADLIVSHNLVRIGYQDDQFYIRHYPKKDQKLNYVR